ncbi:MAG: hypothetical protein H0S84_10320 [Bacteroidales bacterium]|jgi:hypothetical protein|nr:hypothetical protein [Bacteroidales bacterium]
MLNFIEDDATTDGELDKAAIHKAKALVTSADNLFVALTARSIPPLKNQIISKAASESSEKR